MSLKLGIIAALPFEAACFSGKAIRPGTHQIVAPNLYVFYAGMGPNNAAHAAQSLVDLKVDGLVSWGVAGALDPALDSGDTVLPVEVLDADGQLYHVNQSWHAALANKLNHGSVYSKGRLVSTSDVQHNPQQKLKLQQSVQAVAIDMESGSVAKVACAADKPFVVIRTIFDAVTMRIPSSSTNATDEYGRVSVRQLMMGLLRSPAELAQYPKLVSSFTKAKAGLRRVAQLCGNELCISEML